MDRYLVPRGGASAAAAAAAAASVGAPEDMDAVDLRAYLRSRRVNVTADDTLITMKAKLAHLQYSEIATPFPASRRVHNPVEQNTREWYFMRRGEHKMRIGGSEIGVVLGQSHFAKPHSLWQKILAQQDEEWERDEEMPEPCVHGHTCEDIIAEMFEDKMGLSLRPGGYYRHPDEALGEFYGASPDRLVISRSIKEDGVPPGEVCALLEIKAPFRNMYTNIAPQYMAQMQYQMWVSGIRKCYYLAVKLRHDKMEEQGTGRGPRSTPPGETQVYLALVNYSEEYMIWALPRLFYFTECLVERKEPPHDLYDSEVSGYEVPPVPKVSVYTIQKGAWRARPSNAQDKSASGEGDASAAAPVTKD